jgi:hypothetical protein
MKMCQCFCFTIRESFISYSLTRSAGVETSERIGTTHQARNAWIESQTATNCSLPVATTVGAQLLAL